MPADNKLYLCFEYCEFDLKKYMKSQQYKLSAESIKARSPSCFPPARVHVPRPSADWPRGNACATHPNACFCCCAVIHVPDAQRADLVPFAPHLSPVRRF
jgi:hypothetical protein